MAKKVRLQRKGVTLLEVILGLPLLLIVLFATVQFGLLFSNLQRLEMASRAGALVAAERPLTGMALDTEVEDAILQSLNGSGITPGKIELRYVLEDPMNPGMLLPEETQTEGVLNCPPPVFPAAPSSRPYVRVTICVDMTELTPNCMAMFGFDLSNRVSQQTTTYRHEL